MISVNLHAVKISEEETRISRKKFQKNQNIHHEAKERKLTVTAAMQR